MLTSIDLVLARRSGDVQSAVANNIIIGPDLPKDAQQSRIIAQYEQLARPLAKRVVVHIDATLSTTENPVGESPLGQVIADAHLLATKDAGGQMAFMHPGGIRAVLGKPEGGDLVYEDLFTVQPFHSNLVTLTLTGAQIFTILEQQWLYQEPEGNLLQVSHGFTYTWDSDRPVGNRVVPGSVLLDGRAVEGGVTYRVTANAFLAGGGDKFPAFKLGRDRRIGISDVDALEQYVKATPNLTGREEDRVLRLH
jgi:5'-nucleotidase